jgi:hypothetical protein
VLECDFYSVAFEINEDELPVHSQKFSIQNSHQNDLITINTANSSLKIDNNENKSETIGEEPTLNEPFTYNEAMKAPDADEWIKAMEFKLNALDKMCVWEITQLPPNTNI